MHFCQDEVKTLLMYLPYLQHAWLWLRMNVIPKAFALLLALTACCPPSTRVVEHECVHWLTPGPANADCDEGNYLVCVSYDGGVGVEGEDPCFCCYPY